MQHRRFAVLSDQLFGRTGPKIVLRIEIELTASSGCHPARTRLILFGPIADILLHSYKQDYTIKTYLRTLRDYNLTWISRADGS